VQGSVALLTVQFETEGRIHIHIYFTNVLFFIVPTCFVSLFSY